MELVLEFLRLVNGAADEEIDMRGAWETYSFKFADLGRGGCLSFYLPIVFYMSTSSSETI